VGEGQFHISHKNLPVHTKYLEKGLTYQNLLDLIK
jgi:hypothetical protein